MMVTLTARGAGVLRTWLLTGRSTSRSDHFASLRRSEHSGHDPQMPLADLIIRLGCALAWITDGSWDDGRRRTATLSIAMAFARLHAEGCLPKVVDLLR